MPFYYKWTPFFACLAIVYWDEWESKPPPGSFQPHGSTDGRLGYAAGDVLLPELLGTHRLFSMVWFTGSSTTAEVDDPQWLAR